MKEKILKLGIILVILAIFVGSYLVGKFSIEKFYGMEPIKRYPQLIKRNESTTLIQENEPIYGLAPSKENFQSDFTNEGSEVFSQNSAFGLKIIKQANVDLIVEKGKFLEVYHNVASSLSSLNGTTLEARYSKSGESYRGFLTIIVKEEKFDEAIQKLESFGKIENLQVSSSDVTSEYVDLNSRLKVLEEQKNMLTNWLKQAKSIEDLLKLREEIEKVNLEIETIKGRLNYIAFHTNFSKITINISEEGNKKPQSALLYTLKNYFIIPLNTLLYSVIGLLVIVSFLLPWGIIGFVLYKVIKRK